MSNSILRKLSVGNIEDKNPNSDWEKGFMRAIQMLSHAYLNKLIDEKNLPNSLITASYEAGFNKAKELIILAIKSQKDFHLSTVSDLIEHVTTFGDEEV